MPRSEPFEAAVRAACETHVWHRCEYPSTNCTQAKGCLVPKFAATFLAAALPPDPAPELIEAMNDAIYDSENAVDDGLAAYRVLRASLLPGEEPS